MADFSTYPVGKQSEAGVLTSGLAGLGVASAQSGEPLSEALLFGIGGGIGLGYFVYQSADYTALYIATRLVTSETPQSGFLSMICNRLGLEIRQQSASTPAMAEKKLQASLAAGSPVLVYVDPRRLPYPGAASAYQSVLVYRYDPDRESYQVVDRSRIPIDLTSDELSKARQGEGAPKFRAIELAGVPIAPQKLREAVKAGLQEGLVQLYSGFGPANFRSNFGLASLDKWAALLTDTREARGWPKFFPPGGRLFDALLSAYEQIEGRGVPSALRPLYADFLEEAGELLENPALIQAGGAAQAAAQAWSDLSSALLPSQVPLLAQARQLFDQRERVFYHDGRSASDELRELSLKMVAVRRSATQSFPLDQAGTASLLQELHARVLAVKSAEARLAGVVEVALT